MAQVVVPKTSSKPSAVRRSEALPRPALLISRSTACHRDRMAAANRCTLARSARSSAITSSEAPGLVARIAAAAASPRPVRRTASTTWAPLPARPRVTSRPMPRLAPVTTAVMPVRSAISATDQPLVLMPACSPGRGSCWPDSATSPAR